MRRPSLLAAFVLLLTGAALLAGPDALAKGKPKGPVGPPKTGIFQLTVEPPTKYVLMSVPKDYDSALYYPLLFVLHPSTDDPKTSVPEPYVGVWTDVLGPKGWIIAAPASPLYDNETSVQPLMAALQQVKDAYHIDDRRIVIAGHNAGAMMAWRLVVRTPAAFSSIVALSGEIPQDDRNALKGFAGKSAYIFRGSKDSSYTEGMFKADEKYLEFAKVTVKAETKPDWGLEFPTPSGPEIAKWIDGQWPPGTYREKMEAVEKALAAKDLAATSKALAELAADLKKSSYPAVSARLRAFVKAYEEQGRGLIEDARKLVEADPLGAVTQMEAVAKSLKGQRPLDEEANKALQALKKVPAVVEALRKKEAEALASSYMEKASALEAKGDLAKALEAYKKASGLDSSKKEEAQQKVAELEKKVGGG